MFAHSSVVASQAQLSDFFWLQRRGTDTRSKISDAVDDFCKKHDIKLSRKEAEDFVEDIKDAASDAI